MGGTPEGGGQSPPPSRPSHSGWPSIAPQWRVGGGEGGPVGGTGLASRRAERPRPPGLHLPPSWPPRSGWGCRKGWPTRAGRISRGARICYPTSAGLRNLRLLGRAPTQPHVSLQTLVHPRDCSPHTAVDGVALLSALLYRRKGGRGDDDPPLTPQPWPHALCCAGLGGGGEVGCLFLRLHTGSKFFPRREDPGLEMLIMVMALVGAPAACPEAGRGHEARAKRAAMGTC